MSLLPNRDTLPGGKKNRPSSAYIKKRISLDCEVRQRLREDYFLSGRKKKKRDKVIFFYFYREGRFVAFIIPRRLPGDNSRNLLPFQLLYT